jgi:hypothetical protein
VGLPNRSEAIRRLVELGLRAMTSPDIPILLAVLACVLVATALTGWLSMSAFDYFLPGG